MHNSPPSQATSCTATHSIPCLLHNTSVHYYFPHSLTHTLSPNYFSAPTLCSHTYSTLNNIAITAHMFSALQTQCWHTKMRDKKGETPKNQGIPNLTYRSQIGNNAWCSSYLKPQQSYRTIYKLNMKETKKNSVDNNKRSPHTITNTTPTQ